MVMGKNKHDDGMVRQLKHMGKVREGFWLQLVKRQTLIAWLWEEGHSGFLHEQQQNTLFVLWNDTQKRFLIWHRCQQDDIICLCFQKPLQVLANIFVGVKISILLQY